MIDVREYWPWPATGEALTNVFDGGIVQTYSAAQGGVRLRETVNGTWKDDWFYRYDTFRGVLEYEDVYPKTTALQKMMFWTPVICNICVPGKEIIWGGVQKVGDSISGLCQTSGIGGQHGWQRVDFQDLLVSFDTPAGKFFDVLVLEYWQSWSNGLVKGAKTWFAPGMGQIRAEWTLSHAPTGYSMALQSFQKQPAIIS